MPTEIPDTPQTRIEQYLAAANGQDVELPTPLTREEAYLHEIATKMQAGGGVTVEPLSVSANGTYTAPTGKAFSPVTVAVPGGFDYDLKEVTVSNNTPTVDRAFDNFIFVAQIQKTSMPAAADRARMYAYYLMFAYVNGNYIPTGTGANMFNGFSVLTNTAGAETVLGKATSMKNGAVGDTSITFTAFPDQNMQAGKWDVLQIELPAESPIYSFYDL